ncbi:lipopolysaccharide biosynthesis protein [Providencia rettgeri]|uniref:lipopolysaccharide biosynthesis protein n=1 Tax=unclassified Providencia TaxID=2633465 RepID=UPI00234A195E|nr:MULTISPECIES: lipopolysaccharide biosynthesis protein [unclassified Providencia]
MNKNLKQKTTSGLKWSAIEKLTTQFVQLVIMLLLARLLGPASIGLVGMLAVFIAIAQVFVDSGFSNALIRKQDRTELDYSTAFIFNIVISIICYSTLFFTAPFIADFYQQPALIELLRTLSLVIIINSFSIIQKTQFTCEMDFKTQAKCSLISVFFSSIVALTLAYYEYGPWALVGQSITFALINTVLLNLYSRWYPKLKFSKDSFNYLFRFGSKLLASSLLDTIYNNIYQIIIGKVFSAKQVGLFTQANSLSFIPAQSLTSIIQRVTYPMLSQIQNNKNKFEDIYLLTLKLSSCIVFPIIMGIAIIAKPLILLILGNEWANTSELLGILCIGYMLYPIHAVNLNLLQVKSRTDLFLKLEIIKKITITIILLITIPFGLKAICIGIVIQSYIALYLNTIYTDRLVSLTRIMQLYALLPIWLITMAVALIVWYIAQQIDITIIQLVVPIALMPALYITSIKLFQPKIYSVILTTILKKNKQ